MQYTPILLFSPALHVAALWLQTADKSFDEIVLIPPIDRPFEPFQLITPARFLSVSQEIARQVQRKLAKLPNGTGPTRGASSSETTGGENKR